MSVVDCDGRLFVIWKTFTIETGHFQSIFTFCAIYKMYLCYLLFVKTHNTKLFQSICNRVLITKSNIGCSIKFYNTVDWNYCVWIKINKCITLSNIENHFKLLLRVIFFFQNETLELRRCVFSVILMIRICQMFTMPCGVNFKTLMLAY